MREPKQDGFQEFDLEQMEAETEEMLRLRYLNSANAEFKKTSGGFVSLDAFDESYPRVDFCRAFPFTDPDLYISVRTTDEKAKEIGVIKDLNSDVSAQTAEIIREQLKLRYFTPQIKRIISVKTEYGFAYWEVETDAGVCRFTIRMNGGAVVSLTETRVIIHDLDGNRFEIPDVSKLTAKELKKIDVFI